MFVAHMHHFNCSLLQSETWGSSSLPAWDNRAENTAPTQSNNLAEAVKRANKKEKVSVVSQVIKCFRGISFI